MNRVHLIFFLLLTGILLFSTCKHERTQIPKGIGDTNDTGKVIIPPPDDKVCFNTQILPLLTASCAQIGCHNSISHVEGKVLNSYTGIMNVGTAKIMEQIQKAYGKVMPPLPQPRLDAASIALLQKWISEGAQNRICVPMGCDTNNVQYTTHIAPVLNTYCRGCHNTGNKSGNVNLDNYTDARNHTLAGKVLCSITASGVCALMPKGGPALSSCNIRKIQLWAAANCPQ